MYGFVHTSSKRNVTGRIMAVTFFYVDLFIHQSYLIEYNLQNDTSILCDSQVTDILPVSIDSNTPVVIFVQ